MDANEKRKIIQELLDNPKHVDYYYKALEDMGDLKSNYYDYISTESMSCDKELRRVPTADYELCTALLTMLLREDHFCNGSFAERLRDGDVQPLLERMLEVVSSWRASSVVLPWRIKIELA